VSVTSLLSHVTVPYIPYWSFGEEIAVGRGEPTPGDITYTLTTLAALLAHGLGRTELLGESRDSYVSSVARGPASRPEDRFAYDVMLSYDEGQQPFASDFASRLRQRQLRVYDWLWMGRSGAVSESVAQCRHLVVILGGVAREQLRVTDTFLRQAIDDGVGREVFQVLSTALDPSPGTVRSSHRQSEMLLARSPREAELAARQIEAHIRRISVLDALSALRVDSEENPAAVRAAYTRIAELDLSLGDIARERGEFDQARYHYLDAQSDAEKGEFDWGQAIARVGLGDTAVALGDTKLAVAYYRDAADRFGRVKNPSAVAEALLKLGDASVTLNMMNDARDSYERALAVASSQQGGMTQRRLFCRAMSSLGDLANANGDLAEARSHYTEALRLAESVGDSAPDDLTNQHEIFMLHVRLGALDAAEDKFGTARERFQLAIGIIERLGAAVPDDPQLTRERYDLHDQLGTLAALAGDFAEARQEFTASLSIATDRIAVEADSLPWQEALAAAHGKLGTVADEYAVARTHYQLQLDIASRLAAADPTSAERQREVMLCHLNLGNAAAAAGDTSSALTSYQAALEIAQRMGVTNRANYAQWERDKATLREKIAAVRER
jgi:tetratricopeptide (TPR) repeat protein